MHNAFLTIRTVFFALLMYFHVLVLVFASWNITAAKSSGMSAPGASVFLVVTSIFIFVFVAIASLADLICIRGRPAHVRVECAWTLFMSIFQLAASINVTVNGAPTSCQTYAHWAICASSSLLVHVSWLATLIIITYCLTICITSVNHATSLPEIWITPVFRVSWFTAYADAPAPVVISHLPSGKHSKNASSSTSSSEECAVAKYISDQWDKLSRAERQPVTSGPILFTRGRQSIDTTRPSWARQQETRRGIDNPFAKPLPTRKVGPPPPARTQVKEIVTARDTHHVEVYRQSETMRTDSCSALTPRTPTVFPNKIANPDLPIPLPSLSEWIRADAAMGITVHTEPPMSS